MTYSRNGYQPPDSVRIIAKIGYHYGQLGKRFPFAVMWLKDGKRYRKRCANIGEAVLVHQKVSPVVPNATIVSLVRSYDIPSDLRGRLPKPWLWCPRCLKPRKFVLDADGRSFFALKKKWNAEKGRYEWVDRRVAMIFCPMCSCSNKDPVFRRSNQPWETRRFKQGVTRARRRS